jgi:hypothetical protein
VGKGIASDLKESLPPLIRWRPPLPLSRHVHGAKRLADQYRFVLARRGMRWRGDDRRFSGCRDRGHRSGGTRRIGAIDPAQRMHATREWPLPVGIPPGAIITIWRWTLSKAPPIVASSRALRWYARLRERPLATSRSTCVLQLGELGLGDLPTRLPLSILGQGGILLPT